MEVHSEVQSEVHVEINNDPNKEDKEKTNNFFINVGDMIAIVGFGQKPDLPIKK